MPERPDDDGRFGVTGDNRAITWSMKKNKGLTPSRKKEVRNPRVRNKNKFVKAQKKRKGQVREMRTEADKRFVACGQPQRQQHGSGVHCAAVLGSASQRTSVSFQRMPPATSLPPAYPCRDRACPAALALFAICLLALARPLCNCVAGWLADSGIAAKSLASSRQLSEVSSSNEKAEGCREGIRGLEAGKKRCLCFYFTPFWEKIFHKRVQNKRLFEGGWGWGGSVVGGTFYWHGTCKCISYIEYATIVPSLPCLWSERNIN